MRIHQLKYPMFVKLTKDQHCNLRQHVKLIDWHTGYAYYLIGGAGHARAIYKGIALTSPYKEIFYKDIIIPSSSKNPCSETVLEESPKFPENTFTQDKLDGLSPLIYRKKSKRRII